MKGLFCNTKAITNDEFRVELKRKQKGYILVIFIGVVTLFITGMGTPNEVVSNEHLVDVFSGLGVGLIVAGVFLSLKTQLTMKDEEKLKAERLNQTDERLSEISNRSFRCAALIMLVSLYITTLTGAVLIDERLTIFLGINLAVLLMGYLGSYVYYQRKL